MPGSEKAIKKKMFEILLPSLGGAYIDDFTANIKLQRGEGSSSLSLYVRVNRTFAKPTFFATESSSDDNRVGRQSTTTTTKLFFFFNFRCYRSFFGTAF